MVSGILRGYVIWRRYHYHFQAAGE